MEGKYILSSSPHFHGGLSTQRIMLTVIIALLPEVIAGVIFFGLPALAVIVACVASCVLFEYIFCRATHQDNTVSNFSAIVTGILLAMVCPPTLPIWQAILGGAFAILVAKCLFGGLGNNTFNPALTGRAFLFISFPATMGAAWIVPKKIAKTFIKAVLDDAGNYVREETVVDVVASATPLAGVANVDPAHFSSTFLQYFIGYKAGCIGEVSILLILISAIFLIYEHIIDLRAPIAMIATVFVASFFYSVSHGFLMACQQAVLSLLTGGLLFGAVFMVTDYSTTPVTKRGRIVFGLGCGLITFLVRKFGGYPEGVMFSILIMNAVAPLLNNLTSPMYGYLKSAGGAK